MEDNDPAVDQQVGPIEGVFAPTQHLGELTDRDEECGEEDQFDDGQIDRPSRCLRESPAATSLATPQEKGDRTGHDQTGQSTCDLGRWPPDQAIGGETCSGQRRQGEPGCADSEGEEKVRDQVEPADVVFLARTAHRPHDEGDAPSDHQQEQQTEQGDRGQLGSSQTWS